MKNLPDIKLCIIAGSTDWMPQDIAIQQRKKLTDTYKSLYGEEGIYECPICITDNEVSVKRALKDIAKAECNALCVYFANYGPESAGTLLAKEFDGPTLFIASAEESEDGLQMMRKDGMSGFINACYALKLRDTKVYIPSRPIGTLGQCAAMIHDFVPIARTLAAVKGLKVISIGPRPSSYLAANAPSHLLYDIGIEVMEFSELELLNSFEKHSADTRIAEVVAEMERELGTDGNNFPQMLPTWAQYELTVQDWIRNYKGNGKYVALSSTCWPAFPLNFGFVPCYVNSRMTGNGVPIACEADVFGAVSEYIGQCISNDVVTILNLNNTVPENVYEKYIKGKRFNGKEYSQSDLIIGYHCGVTCSQKLKSGSAEPHFVNNLLLGKEKATGTIQGRIAEGPVTLLRIQGGRDNKLRAYVVEGQILPIELDTYGGYGVIAVSEMERFIRNVVIEKQFPNHAAVIFGHYGKELFGVLQQLGINEIEYNHPQEVLYQNENPFENNRH